MTATEVSSLVANVTVGIVAVFAVQAVLLYGVVRQLTTGKPLLFERRESEPNHEDRQPVRLHTR